MAKKGNKKPRVNVSTEHIVDRYSKTLQLIAILVVALLLVMKGIFPAIDTPSYVIIGLMGVAVGLNPEQIRLMFVDVIKSFLGRKTK